MTLPEAIWGELVWLWHATFDGVTWFGRRLCHCQRSREMASHEYD